MKSVRTYNWHVWPSVQKSAHPPLVFFHGFLGDGQDWAPIVAQFPNRQCWAVDLPGHGHTPIVATDSFDGILQTILSDLATIGPKVDVVGYSMGGRLALQIADVAPQQVGRLIIESASPGIDSPAERRARGLFDKLVIQKLQCLPPEQFVDWWCAFPMFGNLQDHPNYPTLRSNRAGFNANQVELAYQILGATARPSLWPRIAQLGVTAYITGQHDVKYKQIAQQLQANCPQIPVHILPKLAHNCHFESPTEFGTLLSQYLPT